MPRPEQFGQPADPHEQERIDALNQVASSYLPEDDQEFLAELDDEGERVGYVYGRLLELSEDPDTILHDYGVTEEESEV